MEIGAIGPGLLVLLGVAAGDSDADADALADKTAHLRIFSPEGRFDRSLVDTGGAALVVSQFTLLADSRKGRRPSFIAAARPEIAAPLVDRFTAALARFGIPVAIGQFGAHMEVSLVNVGPVTIILESGVAN